MGSSTPTTIEIVSHQYQKWEFSLLPELWYTFCNDRGCGTKLVNLQKDFFMSTNRINRIFLQPIVSKQLQMVCSIPTWKFAAYIFLGFSHFFCRCSWLNQRTIILSYLRSVIYVEYLLIYFIFLNNTKKARTKKT